jgi:pimeloyl-ACP methyl ester carboxylesterase
MTRQQDRNETLLVPANGINIAHEAFGDPKGPMLVLIMGLGSQMVLWDEAFCRRLAAAGYRVIRFDNRDIGRSTRFDDAAVPDFQRLQQDLASGRRPQLPYTLADMADDTAALIDALGAARAHVVGESMGGMIGQIMALRHPQRVSTLTSLMSSTGSPDLPPPDAEVLAVLEKPWPIDRRGYVAAFVAAMRLMNGPHRPLEEALAVKWAEQSFEGGLNPAGVARQYAALLAAGDRTAALQRVTVPTLVIHGDADPIFPLACGRATAAAIPGARLRVIAGMGHALPPDAWPEIADAICHHAAAGAA